MNKNVSFLIVILVVVASMFTVAAMWQSGILEGIFGIAEVDLDTRATEVHQQGSGDIWELRVRGSQDGWNEYTNKEMLNTNKYISSWMPEGRSQTIVVEGKFRGDLGWVGPIVWKWYEYRIWWVDKSTNPSVEGWGTPISAPEGTVDWVYPVNPGRHNFPGDYRPSGWTPTEAYVFELEGIRDGFLKVELKLRVDWWGDRWNVAITDQAYIKNGEGRVEVEYPGGYDEVEEGETVKFHAYTGFSGPTAGKPDEGWRLRLYYPDNYPDKGGELVEGCDWDVPDDRHPYTVSWTVPSGIWEPNIHPFQVDLYNSLINQGIREVFVIDFRAAMPPKPDVTPDKNWGYPGDDINVTLIAGENDMTEADIDHIEYCVWRGDREDGNFLIPEWATATPVDIGNNQWRAKFTMTPVAPGEYIIEAIAYDMLGRLSNAGYGFVNIIAYGPAITVEPGDWVEIRFDRTKDIIIPTFSPNRIVYQILNPGGDTVYEISHRPMFIGETTGGWHVADSARFQVPAFPSTGEWQIRVYVGSSGIPLMDTPWIDSPNEPHGGRFEVESSFIDSFAAPYYIHWGAFGETIVNWKLPLHPLVILMWVAIAIVAIVAIYMYLVRTGKIKPIHIRRKK